jgi:ABC-type dipeptide/oligopeptide/nickel transport system permease component
MRSLTLYNRSNQRGAVLVGALAFVAINLLVDVSYAFIDPRTRRNTA